MPSYLRFRRQGEILFRRYVPNHLQPRCGRREVVRRLYGTSPRHASLQAQRLAALYEEAFRLMSERSDLTMPEAVALARQWLRDQMQADEHLLMEASPARAEVARVLQERNAAKLVLVREQLANNDLSRASLVVAGIERQEGLSLTVEGRDRLARAILRAMVSLQETYADRLRGIYRAPSDPDFASNDVISAAVKSVPAQAATPSPTFKETIEKLIAEKRAEGAWDSKSERQARDTFDLFVEHAGDRPVSTYQRPEFRAFKDIVLKLPKLRGKSPALSNKPLANLVAAVEAGAEPIGPKSIKRHMSTLSQAFGWMVEQDLLEKNQAKGIYAIKRTKAENEEREAWSDDQIVKLLSLPIWQGRKSSEFRVKPGTVIVRDAWWWWPIIGMFTGARLGEVAQLRPDDIAEEGGILYFDIGRVGARKVKNAASVRRVPLHKTLIDLGLVERRDRMKAEGRTSLWPEMPPAAYEDQKGGPFTRGFGEMVRRFGIDGPTFHGFRHTVITRLHNLTEGERVISGIVGHKVSGMGSRYGKGINLDVLAQALNRLSYPVDFLALPREGS